MFKNLKIGVRLGLGFGLTVLLLVVVSTLAYVRVGQINAEISGMVNDKFPKTVWANNVIDQVNLIARVLRNSLLIKNVRCQAFFDGGHDAKNLYGATV